MASKGYDYGLGVTNIDTETGIRFGVICSHDISLAWDDTAEAVYGDPTCPQCGNPAQDIDCAPEDYRNLDDWTVQGNDRCCPECKFIFSEDCAYPDIPLEWVINEDEYQAVSVGDDPDIFLCKSPYYTHAQFCSPCAPGACHLGHPTPDGEKTYCFGHDWFENEVAPYPVYRVSDNQLVPPPLHDRSDDTTYRAGYDHACGYHD